MSVKTVRVAEHPDLVSAEQWAAELGKHPKSLTRDARAGEGPPRVRIGNRSYYYREQCDAYLRQLFEDAAA